jgi:cobalt-zinc-cadmium resistance protein CzcA
MNFPEVKTVFAKIGTAEMATDPMPPSVSDNYVILKALRVAEPEKAQGPTRPRDGGCRHETARQQLRIHPADPDAVQRTHLWRARDVAVKVYGDDTDVLHAVGEEIERVLGSVPGATDVNLEQTTGLPMMTIQLKRDMLARYGLNVADVQEVIEIALGGKTAGEVFAGDRRFDLVVRLPENLRTDLEAIKRIPIPLQAHDNDTSLARETGASPNRQSAIGNPQSSQSYVPLSAVADFVTAHRPEPDQPRERQAPDRRHRQCARPRPRLVRGRSTAEDSNA